VTFHRREVLGALGAASASTLLWALGCGSSAPNLRRAPQVSGEVRTWLHDAVARLAAVYPFAHALAVSRRRTTAARDVLGAGIARLRAEGVVLTVRDRDGSWHEHAISELSRDGVDAAARALGAARQLRAIDFGRTPDTPDEPPHLEDRDLHRRVELLLEGDAALARRLVYAAASIDIDDAIVWSVAPGRDLEQRLVRIRNTALRAAWNGTHPVVREAEHAWSGWLDDQPLTADDLIATSESALQVNTPGGFDDGERTVVLDPSVAAVVLDIAVRGLLTTDAARRPEVVRRLADSAAAFASPLVTLIDDPTTPAAFGAFAFDDEGEPAAPLTLIDAGRLAARLSDRAAASGLPPNRAATTSGGSSSATPGSAATAGGSSSASAGPTASSGGRGRRPGHVGHLAVAPSHLRLVPGSSDRRELYDDGFLLEGALGANLDPTGDRIRIACARARELKGGNTTGQLYADVELVGSLSALLTAVDAVASTPTSFAPRDPTERDPTWRSISTPAVRTRGLVRAPRTRS
jgi:predicted Zn-dependent protease